LFIVPLCTSVVVFSLLVRHTPTASPCPYTTLFRSASVIMEEINRSGGNAGAVHGQMYNMGTLLRSGSKAQKEKYLPGIAAGKLRIQSMAVTEPTTGSDTTKLKTTAVKREGRWVVNGQKVWISRVQHSDLMILLARTTPLT